MEPFRYLARASHFTLLEILAIELESRDQRIKALEEDNATLTLEIQSRMVENEKLEQALLDELGALSSTTTWEAYRALHPPAD